MKGSPERGLRLGSCQVFYCRRCSRRNEGFPGEGIETSATSMATTAAMCTGGMKGSPERGLRPETPRTGRVLGVRRNEGFPGEGIETVIVRQIVARGVRGGMKGSPERGLRHPAPSTRTQSALGRNEGFPGEGIETDGALAGPARGGHGGMKGSPERGLRLAYAPSDPRPSLPGGMKGSPERGLRPRNGDQCSAWENLRAE